MNINWDVAEEAARRWQERAAKRGETIKKLEEGGPLAADTPGRIQQHLERLEAAVTEARAARAVISAEPEVAGTATVSSLVDVIGRERVMGDPDFQGINFLELALAVARFVGRVNIRTGPGRTVGFGTGFMVSPRLLLTNNHVLDSAEAARHSEVEFDYQYDRSGRLLTVVPYGLEPNTFFITSKELDYTLVAVKGQSVSGVDLKFYGWTRLIEEQGKTLIGKPLNIIQHPKGEAKQIVLRHNKLIDLLDTFAHYLTDTEPGSSGSPVYNDQWEVVALHHSGVPKIENGNYIAKDGSIWKPGMDLDDLAWVANEGIRVSSIVRDVKNRKLITSEQRRLRDEMLNAEPLEPIEAARAAALDSIQRSSNGKEEDDGHSKTSEVKAEAGAVTWSIPLEVTVRLGTPRLTGDQGAPSPIADTKVGSGAPAEQPSPSPEPTSGPMDPELQEALAELEKASTKKYYDAEKDHEARDAYYEGLPGDLDPEEFYRRLRDLLKNTHNKELKYKPNVHVYPWVDLHEGQPKPKLKSIYSGKDFDPVEFIEADFRVEQERLRLRETLMREATFGTVGTQEQFDLLEATLPYNCEHVVPQSWFGKKEPMRGDLHHLFACESGCNSFRSNTPYYEFEDFEEAIREECGKREELKFEPSSGKGAVARATLYFLLRYPGEINATKKEYNTDRIEMILEWHRNFKVSKYERHRNAAIYEKQGNRNPLIDFPEWADRIDFTQGLG